MSATLFLSCFLVYIVAVSAFGLWITRHRQSGDDFLIGGRSIPFLLTLGTTLATMVGTGSSMGAVGKAYESGWFGGLYGLGGGIGVLLVAWMFAPARKHRFMTMSEELSSYVGANRTVMNAVAVFVFLSNVGWLGAHVVGGAFYLTFVTGIDPALAKTLIAIGFAIYSIIGGYRAVVWTDTIQAVVLFLGFVLTAIFAYQQVGGFSGMQEVHAAKVEGGGGMRFLPAISLVAAIAVGQLGSSANRQRIYSGRSVGEVRKAFVTCGVLYFFFSLLPVIIGIAAFDANPGLRASDHAFPWMAVEMLPVALGVIVILAGLSASMSSASSDVITAVTVVIRELYFMAFRRFPAPGRVVPVSRWALTITTLLALGMAFAATDVIGYIKDMVALFMSGMVVCALLGRWWPRFNGVGAISALVAAFFTALAFRFLPAQTEWWGGSVIPALGAAAVAGVVASLLSPPDARTHEEAVEFLARERAQMSAE